MSNVRGARLLRQAALTVLLVCVPTAYARLTATPVWADKLDPVLSQRVGLLGRSRVIVRAAGAGALTQLRLQVAVPGVRIVRVLPGIDALALDAPNATIPLLAANPLVVRLSLDRAVAGANERTGATVGASTVRQTLGYDGTGVGVAIVDSGAWSDHDDLDGRASGASRVTRFVDLVNGRAEPYDDYGHGTHVAGIVAGSGFDSGGPHAGMAPGASLVVLKALDANGRGRISDVIAALDYVVANKDALRIRVVNLSVAAAVYESYDSDPLALATKRTVASGIVVVAAAGNAGRGPRGTTQYGGITAPGNAPWVLTVGASSHQGTTDRADDQMAAFSSRGPTAVDHGAKPDLVAPGVGTESLADPYSTLYASAGPALLPGTASTPYLPYQSLSGTSMAAPVVAGTVALMLQANPGLTPNAVKAILQYTAETYPHHDYLTQGAGFLNARGAVELAAYLASPSTRPYPDTTGWNAQLIWGNHLANGGRLTADANAWAANVMWGDGLTPAGQRVRWGISCTDASCDPQTAGVWQAPCANLLCTLLSGDVQFTPNVVWGSLCGGADCPIPWTAGGVSSTSDAEADTVVWGTNDGEGDTVVWGTSCSDPSCEPVVWTRQ